MRRLVVLCGVLWLVLAASARADVFDDNPATASLGAGDAWVFARAADGATLARHWSGGAWGNWASLGGTATSGPAAVAYGSTVRVYVRGSDSAIYENVFDGASWSGWASLGGVASSAPAVAVRRGSEGYLDLAVRGADNAIWFRTLIPGTGWSNWASLGGNLTSAPALNSQSAGIVNVWARGIDGTLQQRAWNGSAWSDWMSLGGGIIGAPTAVSRAENVVDIYVRGAGNATYQRYWLAGSGWSDWFLLDSGAIDSSPVAGADTFNREWLMARRGDRLVQNWWTGSTGWTGWTDFGPVAVPVVQAPPPPAPPRPDGEVSLLAGLRCTPPEGRLRVSVEVRKPSGKRKARVVKIVFYTKGKGRRVHTDRKAPFVVRMKINRPAGAAGRVYARVYYRRSAKGRLHSKTVSRRYVVCR